jgi:hypothetical protein
VEQLSLKRLEVEPEAEVAEDEVALGLDSTHKVRSSLLRVDSVTHARARIHFGLPELWPNCWICFLLLRFPSSGIPVLGGSGCDG